LHIDGKNTSDEHLKRLTVDLTRAETEVARLSEQAGQLSQEKVELTNRLTQQQHALVDAEMRIGQLTNELKTST